MDYRQNVEKTNCLSMKYRRRKLSTRITLVALALVVGVALTLLYTIQKQQRATLLIRYDTELENSLQLNESRLKQATSELRQNALFLAHTPPIAGIIRTDHNHGFDPRDRNTRAVWQQRLQEIFTAFTKAHPEYYQIRYIGVADGGREIVRVNNYPGHAVEIASGKALQQEAARDYFQATLKLPPDAVYLSDITLNREHGVIEQPHLPTLCASVPVYQPDGKIFGMLVINMDMGDLLTAIAFSPPHQSQTYLANRNGYYLIHPERDKTFGFESGKGFRIQQDFPMLATLFGQQKEDHWFVRQQNIAGGKQHLVAERIHFDISRPGHYLVLAKSLPDSVIDEQLGNVGYQGIAMVILAASILGGLVLLTFNRMFTPLKKLTESARAIASAGDYDVTLPETGGGGEIGALTDALRTMLQQVKQREQEILRLNDELELRVQERTSELLAKQAELNLAASVFHTTVEGVMITDTRSVIQSVNPAFTQITGYTAEEAVGKKPNMLRSAHHGPEFYRMLWEKLLRDGVWQGEIWNRRKSGEAYLEWLTISQVVDSEGQPVRYVAVFNDITESRRKDEHIRHLAFHDALTGLPNRTLLLDRLQHSIEFSSREPIHLGLMFIDLDKFKSVNDALGHNIGDKLLQEVARRLGRCVRESDTIARMGGDEFVVLMEHGEGMDGYAMVASKIIAMLSEPMDIAGHVVQVSASVGIACFPEDGSNALDLMKHADIAMYSAKSSGRNTYHFFQSSMTEKAIKRLRLEMELRQAISDRQLELFYQPKIELSTNRPCGMEALVRWRHPSLGLIPPIDFIPIAEESGLIIPLGDWVLEEACRQIGAWQSSGLPPCRIAVNISARQLHEGDLVERIEQLTQLYGIPPSTLEIELTESVIMSRPGDVIDLFKRLRKLGVTIAMDDFGTGYSSLAYLRRLPIDVLKIDRSFVSDVEHNEDGAQIVKTILSLAHALGIKIVAEGIETPPQADFLRAGGCTLGQGYLYAKPMPAGELEAWLETYPRTA